MRLGAKLGFMRIDLGWWLALCVGQALCGCSSDAAPSAGTAGGAGTAGSAGSAGTAGSAGATGLGGAAGGGTGGSDAASAGAMSAMGPVGPRFIGRFDQSNAQAPVFAWSGTAISARFMGSSVGVTLTDSGSNAFEVVLDGKHTVLATQAGKKTYSLGSGLAEGAHDLLLYRRSEAFFGETTFGGFDLDASAYLPVAPLPKRRLEVIGDSISAGYGNEGVFPCTFGSKTENHYLTYGALAARELQAELYTEAWSGIGMLRNNAGDTTGTMPERYGRALPERAASTWDFSQFVPDAVVINLGTNDFAQGDPTIAFQAKYTQFVADLRGHYPAARLFLAVGSMLGGLQYQQASVYLKGVIAARANAGDPNLALLELGTQDAQNDQLGCDYHPSLKTHQKMAAKLVAALHADLGW